MTVDQARSTFLVLQATSREGIYCGPEMLL